MTLRIGHNVEAAGISRNVAASTDRVAVAMQRLSSGLRINSAADDTAGLSISERLRGQIRGLETADRNIQDGMSMLDVIDGALDAVASILQRARELAVQFNNDTNSVTAKNSILQEMIALSDEVGRIAATTEFNGTILLQDSIKVITLQVGANAGEQIGITLVDLFSSTGLVNPATFFTLPWVPADIAGLDTHIKDVAAARGMFGAISNRLEYARSANQSRQSSMLSAESRIVDTDMAEEMTVLARHQLLQQSGMSMLQMNLQSQASILSLLNQ